MVESYPVALERLLKWSVLLRSPKCWPGVSEETAEVARAFMKPATVTHLLLTNDAPVLRRAQA